MATRYPADIINNVKQRKQPDSVSELTKGTVTGSAIGLAGGILVWYFRRGNFFVTAVIGLMAGGLVSRLFIANKEPEK